MGISLGPGSVAIGVVITDSDAALGFYRDLLGMEHVADVPMPVPGGGTMHRLMCGATLVKLAKLNDTPEARPARGGLVGGTGYRWITVDVADIEGAVSACADAGVRVLLGVTDVGPGLRVAMVSDPDGNVVELAEFDERSGVDRARMSSGSNADG